MAIPASELKVGDVLYDVHTERAGNTTIRVECCWRATVREVGEDDRGVFAMISWNGNAPRKKYSTDYKRWPKEWIRGREATFGRGGRRCEICGAQEQDGHRDTCEHPRAVKARAKATKQRRIDMAATLVQLLADLGVAAEAKRDRVIVLDPSDLIDLLDRGVV